uniref:S-formylglutathione hydrolase n=1 Tax=Salmo trutta TaxID=8032 RepID=A0A674CFR5_SALTR
MALTQVATRSTELKCKMNFAIYLPPKAENGKCPVLYWLSGLTCMEQNFITNAGRQLLSMESSSLHQTPVVVTLRVKSWDFGTGAGFYVNATQEPWKSNYRMYAYITEVINANFPTDPEKMSISGHSMGGNTDLCLLFATICNPSQKAFNGYLGKDKKAREAYDVTVLAASYSGPHQLLPDNLIAFCSEKIPVMFRLQPGYDHSYFFINDHVKHHAKFLNA